MMPELRLSRCYRAVIIEDDFEFRKELHLRLWWYFRGSVQIVAEAGSVASGIKAVAQHKPDIIFLDMELPDGVGYDVLDAFRDEVMYNKVFTLVISAYEQYRKGGFRHRIAEYLLKGFTDQEFVDAITHLLQIVEAQLSPIEPSSEPVIAPIAKSANAPKSESIGESNDEALIEPLVWLPTQNGSIHVNPLECLYCEADSKGTHLVFPNNRHIIVKMLLKDVEMIFRPYGFLRIHLSHCVNLSVVERTHSLSNPKKASLEIRHGLIKPPYSSLIKVGRTYLKAVQSHFQHIMNK